MHKPYIALHFNAAIHKGNWVDVSPRYPQLRGVLYHNLFFLLEHLQLPSIYLENEKGKFFDVLGEVRALIS